jgi:hypothetical protein
MRSSRDELLAKYEATQSTFYLGNAAAPQQVAQVDQLNRQLLMMSFHNSNFGNNNNNSHSPTGWNEEEEAYDEETMKGKIQSDLLEDDEWD